MNRKPHIALLLAASLSVVCLHASPNGKADSTLKKVEEKGFRDLFIENGVSTADATASINPQVMPFVQDYLNRNQRRLESMKKWAGPYFRMMDGILTSYGLPRELKYLAVIESDLHAYALSWAGAVGPWQFMPETARRMGLIVNGRVDERTDYYKSTHAAARYLKELYGQLGDWLLVIAAYNGGPGRVKSAISRSGSRSFWQLQYGLPEESRLHVKKFISTHYVMEGSGGQTTSTRAEWNNMQAAILNQVENNASNLTAEEIASTETTEVQGRYNSVVLANILTLDIVYFNKLNPHFDKLVNGEKGYTLRLPQDKMPLFKQNRYNILYQSLINAIGGPSPEK